MKKSMLLKAILTLGVSTFAAAALAVSVGGAPQTVQAIQTHNSFGFIVPTWVDGSGEIYYNVDVVQQTAQQILQQLGATHVQVFVSGEPEQVEANPSVEVSFDSLRLPSAQLTGPLKSASWSPVTLQGDDGVLAQGILQGIQSHFEIRNLKATQTGRNGLDFGYRDTLDTLVAR